MTGKAPVAQLDRALPSEGKGQKFESSRARHFPRNMPTPPVSPNFDGAVRRLVLATDDFDDDPRSLRLRLVDTDHFV
jgi:hypothetical protein